MPQDQDERIVDGRVNTILLPTKERTAKRIDGDRDVVIEEGDRGGIQMRSFAFPLDFYLRKEIISRLQWRAGAKYHRLWRQGCLTGFVQFQYRESDGGERNMEFVPPGAFAKEWRHAELAIRDIPQRRIAYRVCCEGITLALNPDFSSKRTAQRQGMPLLLEALDDLIKHFRYGDDHQTVDSP